MWTPLKYHLYTMEAKKNLIKVYLQSLHFFFTITIVAVVDLMIFMSLFKYPSVSLFTVPAAGFTQRATIDPGLNEIHVLSVSRSLLSLQFFTSPSLLLRKS